MDVFRPELHAYGLRAFLDVARDNLSSAKLTELLAPYGVTQASFEDTEAWVSLEFVEAFLDDLVRATNDPQLVDRAARLSLTRKYLGPIYTFVRTFGNTLSTYSQIAKSTHRFNKTGDYTIDVTGRSSCTLTFVPSKTIGRERGPHMCRIREVSFTVVPPMFDMAPAHVTHPRCMLRGDDCCVYDVHWTEKPDERLIGLMVALSSAAVGAGGASFVGASGTLIALVSVACAAAGWGLGKAASLQRALDERVREIGEQQDALARSMYTNEQRFSELLEAKAEVDRKVEQRTQELRKASEQLSATLSKVQELDRAKTDFFNNVSHELRSPLTLILAPLDDLVRGRRPAGGDSQAFETMHRNASRLLRLINQLLDLAKIDSGQMKITEAPTDLCGLVRNSLRGFQSAAERKGLELSVQAPDVMPPVLLDAFWVDSALTNLVANALRLTPSGGSVRVTVEDHGANVSVAVADSGPGIAPEDQLKVFERFAQGDSSKRVVGGTGIGLALVREAARLHGGDVSLQSDLGKGSTFTITLPRRTVPAGSAHSSSLQPRVSPSLAPALKPNAVEEVRDSGRTADRPGPAGAPLAIVVEDNPDLRVFIADVLSVRYQVRGAMEGSEGLALARALRPDVIISDVAMPGMDGYALCRAVRADKDTAGIPILLVTARTEVSSVLQGFDAGANDYLLKPFHATELLARVDVHVHVRRLSGQLARHERLAALGTLAASVAHNVRNPLSALISGLPAIRSRLGSSIDQSTGELMAIMLDCAERIERTTLDLLDLSRLDREATGEFAPGRGLLACTRMVIPRLTLGIELDSQVDDAAQAWGRAGDITHAFMNVIDNALRAVGSRGRVEVRGWLEGKWYVVTVADSGPGVDPSMMDRIFEPFFTTRPSGEGTGLGLSIARQIMQEHGGTVSVTKSHLGGALFTMRLPLRPAALAVA